MPEIDRLYTEGSWHGMPRYQCTQCPFDSLNEEVIRDHIRLRHMAPEPTTRTVAGLVDAHGNPITVTEVTDG